MLSKMKYHGTFFYWAEMISYNRTDSTEDMRSLLHYHKDT